MVGRNRSDVYIRPTTLSKSADVKTQITPSQNGPRTGIEEEEKDH